MSTRWSFAGEPRRRQDALIAEQEERIRDNRYYLDHWDLDPQSARNAQRNIQAARDTLQAWTGRRDARPQPPAPAPSACPRARGHAMWSVILLAAAIAAVVLFAWLGSPG